MTARLQPPSDPRVQGQQHFALGGGTDQRARGQMRTEAGPRPAISPLRKMIKIVPPQLILFSVRAPTTPSRSGDS